jgi:hypothetical protein
MPNKDAMDETIQKWNSLLEGLGDVKYKLFKFVRIYENTVKNNDPKDLKLLLSTLYRVFKKIEDINVSRSHNNSRVLLEFEDSDFYIQDSIMIDIVMSFCDAVSQMIIEELSNKTLEGIAYLKVDRKDGKANVSVYY